jgi:hypothetical protein
LTWLNLQIEAHQGPCHFSLIDLTFKLQPGSSITMLVRDVDKLDPLPDEKLRQLDEEYVVSRTAAHMCSMLLSHLHVQQSDAVCNAHAVWLITAYYYILQMQHQLDKLLGGLMSDILKHKPQDPLQYIIDSITLGPEHAMQVCVLTCISLYSNTIMTSSVQ